jgi:amino acid transporter
VVGVFAIIIPLWVCQYRAGRIGGTHEVIFEFDATSGWQPLGLAGTIGMVPMIGMLIGYDCSAHLSEETYDASRTLPRVIMWAVIGNAVLLLLVGITYIFCLGDTKSALNTDTYQPVVQVFYNATGSKAGTSIMVVIVCIVLLSACIGQVATASRQMWSFARDRGMFEVMECLELVKC